MTRRPPGRGPIEGREGTMLSEEQVREYIATARRVRKIRSLRPTTVGMPGFAFEARYPEEVAAIEAIIADRAELKAELARLHAAVAALAGACRYVIEWLEIWSDREADEGRIYRGVNLQHMANRLDKALAAAEPRPAGDATAADDAKGG